MRTVNDWCREHGHITPEVAIEGLAAKIGCSSETTRRYWREETSVFGLLVLRADLKPYPVWELRDSPAKGQGKAEG